MATIMDQRVAALQQDQQQMRSITEFTDSLIQVLSNTEGKVGKALMRELVAPSLVRALELGSEEPRRRFLEALSGNIYKFPLQEQRSLSRIHPVEISSEYQNLASFVEDEPAASSSSPAGGSVGAPGCIASAAPAEDPGPLGELRRRLAALPQRPTAAAADEMLVRLKDGEATIAVEAASANHRRAFFVDVRLGLAKLPEASQRELCEHFPDLRGEILRLVESMTQEISRWLDEKRHSERRNGVGGVGGVGGGSAAALLLKLKTLFQAVLSPPFLASFKNVGATEKRAKEAFLLKLALCLRAVSEASRHTTESGAQHIIAQAGQLRRHFFHVEGYGELMEDWLQSRLKQFNEEFTGRVGSVLASNTQPVLARLRRTFRPGRWLSLSDAQVEDDIFAVFLDESFPRHVLFDESVAKMLRSVSSYSGAACDFQVYAGIARLPPVPGAAAAARVAPPRDGIEAALQQILQRLPPFPPLRRVRPGMFLFGRLEVEFFVRSVGLTARVQGSSEEMPAEDFFIGHGPEQFPAVPALAVQASLQSPHGPASTGVEDAPAALPALPFGASSAQISALQPSAGSSAAFASSMGLASVPRAPAPPMALGPARYEPYPSGQATPIGLPPAMAPGSLLGQMPPPVAKFGIEDDEI